MKKHSLAITLALIGGLAHGQDKDGMRTGAHYHPPPILTAEQYRLSLVEWWMGFTSPMKGGDQTLAGMGDEAAADILKILPTRPPLSAAETQTALDIVHKAFTVPRAITKVADRKPVAALALLQKFQATAVDQLVKERIAAETNFLNAVPQTFPPETLPANAVFGPNPFPPK